MKKYICPWKSTYAYEKVHMPIKKYIYLRVLTNQNKQIKTNHKYLHIYKRREKLPCWKNEIVESNIISEFDSYSLFTKEARLMQG